jgi:hypothetical protein
MTRKTSESSSIVELRSKLRSASKSSAPSLRETEISVQIASPIPSWGVKDKALLLPTRPIAIEDPATIAARDVADHHGPSLVRAYWALRSRHPRCVQMRKLESEINRTDERGITSMLSIYIVFLRSMCPLLEFASAQSRWIEKTANPCRLALHAMLGYRLGRIEEFQ